MKDFLIVFELKSRELENASLLAAELEFRGYSVAIHCVTSLKRFFTKAHVVIAPHLYDDFQVVAIAKNIWRSHKKIIDLQYEQVLCENGHDGCHNPSGEAVHAQHIAWGQAQYDTYINHGISPSRVHKVGHLGMDFYRSEFDSYYKTKEDLSINYGLDLSKEWVLFISSFSYCNRTEKELETFEKLFAGTRIFADYSNASQKVLIEWLREMALKHKDKCFIYRPHPAEKSSPIFEKLESEIPNFKCIGDWSVRQWVRVCDKLYTWYSTSIVDAYFAGRNCQILRPLDMPKGFEVDIMVNAKMISTMSAFDLSLDSDDNEFPIKDSIIRHYYGDVSNRPFFMIMADLCEKIYKDDSCAYDYNYGSRFNILNSSSFSVAVNNYILRLLSDICSKYHVSKFLNLFHIKSNLIERLENTNGGTNHEITYYKKRFSKIVALFH